MRNRIKQLRKEAGYSQEELAKKCAVSRQTINAIENDKYDPTLALAFSLAKVPSRFLRTFRQPHRPALRCGYPSSSVTSR